MKKAIIVIITLALMYGSYYVGTTKSKTIEKIVEVPVETKVEVLVEKVVEKIVEVPVEKVVEKKVIANKPAEGITKVEQKPCTPVSDAEYERLKYYIIDVISHHPDFEAVDRIYTLLIRDDWRKLY